ncbi:hypothetical protein [Arenimonas sp.]|uniref:hypothetical protein n=1 Tax=Arenimonas sp. TaxID=1872635 RepID=UPI002E3268EB|nr:hypothetical protein [Arenimonas sp.]HEX4852751.1 hypothetical protein [Arenimonas sp.]
MTLLIKPTLALAAVLFVGECFAQYSGKYGCTDDCSGHEAGYAWAERNGIDDPDDCGGRSQSFIEGCWDYAEQQQAEEVHVTEDGEECDPDYDDDCLPEDEW